MAKLPEFSNIQYGYAFDSAYFTEDSTFIPLVRIRDVKRGYSETFYSGNYSADYVIDNGSLLVGMDGEFNIARWKGGKALLNQRVCKITAKRNVDEEYVRFALTKALKEIENRTSFVTVKHLSAKELNNLELCLPSYADQILISGVLTNIEKIITTRQQQLQKLDDLVKARFAELFGDGAYYIAPLIDLIKEGAGLSYGIVQPGDDGTGDMGVLRPVDLVDGKISVDSIKYIDRTLGNGFQKTELTGDELLITVRGTTGITALTDDRFAGMNVTRGIAVVRYDRHKINPIYLNVYLNTDKSQRYIQEHTRGATLQQINLSDLRVQEIPVPPMARQDEFAAFEKQIDEIKANVIIAMERTQVLFDSLMQKYFG